MINIDYSSIFRNYILASSKVKYTRDNFVYLRSDTQPIHWNSFQSSWFVMLHAFHVLWCIIDTKGVRWLQPYFEFPVGAEAAEERRKRDSGIHIMQICLCCLTSWNNVDGGQPSGRVPIALLYYFANVIAVCYVRSPINIMRTGGPPFDRICASLWCGIQPEIDRSMIKLINVAVLAAEWLESRKYNAKDASLMENRCIVKRVLQM